MQLTTVRKNLNRSSETYIDSTCLPGEFALTANHQGISRVYYFEGEYADPEAELVRRADIHPSRNAKGTQTKRVVYYQGGDSLTGGVETKTPRK